MKTKIIYPIVSSEQDIYLEQLSLSLHSLRRVAPGAEVCILTDELTYCSLNTIRLKEIDEADKIVVAKIDESLCAKERSRCIKTSVRQYFEGSILVVDADTIFTQEIDDIDNIPSHICAVSDLNASSFMYNRNRDIIIKRTNRCYNFPIENEPIYFNSGVVFSRDTEEAITFYKKWNKYYTISSEKGLFLDQPAFAYANYILNHIVSELGSEWNCQVGVCSLKQLQYAKIYHYFNNGNITPLNSADIFKKLKQTGLMDNRLIEIMDNPLQLFDPEPVLLRGNDVSFSSSDTYKLAKAIYQSNLGGIVESAAKGLRRAKIKYMLRD